MFSKKACILCSQEYPSDETVCPADGTMLTPVNRDHYLGTILDGKYEVQEVIGGGGMGLVYKARHLTIDRIVAIKMLHQHLTNSTEALKRFQLEAQALSCLSSPNILTIFEFGLTLEGQPFMVMDYLEGKSLSDLLTEEGPLPVKRALDIFTQICAGLGHAHQKGVLHRDLKPSNIMLVSYGEDQTDFVKIVDFGIAKLLNCQEGMEANLTRAGEVHGSPLYMSPEQCRGLELDNRSDLYSLGCVMYKALTGVSAFSGSEVIELLFKQVSETPAPFAQVCTTSIPAALEAIVMRTLAKLPEDRFASMTELKDALEAYKLRLQEDEESSITQTVRTVIVAQGSSSLASKFTSGRATSQYGTGASPGYDNSDRCRPSNSDASAVGGPTGSSSMLSNNSQGTVNSAANLLAKLSPQTAATAPQPLSPLQRIATDSSSLRLPQTQDAPAPSPTKTAPDKPNSFSPKSRATDALPDWLYLLKGALANRMIAISVAGALVAAGAIFFLAVSSEKTQHLTNSRGNTGVPSNSQPVNAQTDLQTQNSEDSMKLQDIPGSAEHPPATATASRSAATPPATATTSRSVATPPATAAASRSAATPPATAAASRSAATPPATAAASRSVATPPATATANVTETPGPDSETEKEGDEQTKVATYLGHHKKHHQVVHTPHRHAYSSYGF